MDRTATRNVAAGSLKLRKPPSGPHRLVDGRPRSTEIRVQAARSHRFVRALARRRRLRKYRAMAEGAARQWLSASALHRHEGGERGGSERRPRRVLHAQRRVGHRQPRAALLLDIHHLELVLVLVARPILLSAGIT
jgi:hypothetical protein